MTESLVAHVVNPRVLNCCKGQTLSQTAKTCGLRFVISTQNDANPEQIQSSVNASDCFHQCFHIWSLLPAVHRNKFGFNPGTVPGRVSSVNSNKNPA
uniref:Uncharacterized protein n=1 Tax=Pseudomonas fluorescens (strain SBW25) TaxID=216595 RepID=A4V7B2_PSEFS|nr:hypothetical protein pQBR0013 [Pseudomonas fluorescens SBW25]